jgi:hypothetical protein
VDSNLAIGSYGFCLADKRGSSGANERESQFDGCLPAFILIANAHFGPFVVGEEGKTERARKVPLLIFRRAADVENDAG